MFAIHLIIFSKFSMDLDQTCHKGSYNKLSCEFKFVSYQPSIIYPLHTQEPNQSSSVFMKTAQN
jgi:hypothetical protein